MADYKPLLAGPIGVFDSGLGGLTVHKALAEALPNETLHYYGDTAHMPYGDKSTDELQQYIGAIAAWLLQQQAKAIVIACNTATAAGDALVRALAGKVPVIEVVTPTVLEANDQLTANRVGVIATQSTVNSGIYPRIFEAQHPGIEVVQVATPKLAPMIEQGYPTGKFDAAVLAEAVAHHGFATVDTLVLGCTHYPLVGAQLAQHFSATHGHTPRLVNSIAPTVEAVKMALAKLQLLRKDPGPRGGFFVSQLRKGFTDAAQLFMGIPLTLEVVPLS